MQTYTAATRIERASELHLDHVPFAEGEEVNVIVMRRRARGKSSQQDAGGCLMCPAAHAPASERWARIAEMPFRQLRVLGDPLEVAIEMVELGVRLQSRSGDDQIGGGYRETVSTKPKAQITGPLKHGGSTR